MTFFIILNFEFQFQKIFNKLKFVRLENLKLIHILADFLSSFDM